MIKNNQVLAGKFEITLNGKALPDDITSDIKEVVVQEDRNQPAMFSIKIEIGDFLKKFTQDKVNIDLFKPKDEVKIKMGFDDLKKEDYLIVGEIASVEPNFQEPFTMEIRGYDRLRQLQQASDTRSFPKMKDKEIVSTIAGEAQLTPQVDDTEATNDYVFQNNQSYYQFLVDRAKRLGYEIAVADKTLFFRKPKEDKTPEITFKYGEDLHSFSVRVQAVPDGQKVESRSWDAKQKKEIVHTTEIKASGPAALPSRGLKGSPMVVNTMAGDATEAEQVANARQEEIQKKMITGNGQYCGNPKIRAGKTIGIEGLGTQFSGTYYVTGSTHKVNDEGYSTEFSAFKVQKS